MFSYNNVGSSASSKLKEDSSCANNTRNQANGRFINGNQVASHSFPWVVRIGEGKCNVFCGGALIKNNIVLTTAHCQTEDMKFVTIGDHDCMQMDDDEIQIKIKQWIGHQYFFIPRNKKYALNDISIVVLERKVEYSRNVMPLCLPRKNDHYNLTNMAADVAGWGDHGVDETRDTD